MNTSRIANAIARIEERRSKLFQQDDVPWPKDEAAELLASPELSTIPDITGMLTHANYHVHKKAAEALGERRDVATIPALIEALGDTDQGVEWEDEYGINSEFPVNQYASNALKKIGASAVPALWEALKHTNEHVRSCAAIILSEILGVYAIPVLQEALNGTCGDPLPSAALALGNLGDVSAVPALIAALKSENETVRIFAAVALGEIGDPAAVPALMAILNDTHVEVVLAALAVLKELNDPSIFPQIIPLLKHSEEQVRQNAIRTLEKYDDPNVIAALLDSLQDKSDRVRSCAAYSLRETADSSAIPALTLALQDKERDVVIYAAVALGRLREHSTVPALINALSSTDLGVRNAASGALGQIGDEAAVPALIAALKYPDTDEWHYRGRTIGALLKIGSPAVAPLMEVLKHHNPILCSEVAHDLRIRALDAKDSEVRQTAQIVLDWLQKERDSVPAHNKLAFRHRLMSYWRRLFQK